jgi:predicted nucleotidyltransferase
MANVASKKVPFKELCGAVRPIAEEYGVKRVILFGSMARGDDTYESDYDLCVDLGRIDDLVKMCGFIIELESALGRSVDVVSERTLDKDLLAEVLAHGRLVYEA